MEQIKINNNIEKAHSKIVKKLKGKNITSLLKESAMESNMSNT